MFHVYVLFLILSGIAMLVMAFVRTDYAKRRQVLNFILGAGFTVYGLYLLLVFKGGHYLLFYYVFVLPVLMIYQFFRDRARAKARQASASQAGPGYPAANQAGPGYQPANQAGPAYPPAGASFPPSVSPWGTGQEAGNGQTPGYQPDVNRW
jgi:hypothetical protein